MKIFVEAEKSIEGEEDVFVFLDEVNTCAHMGLLEEVIRSRCLNGIPIKDNIRILAALNPYRILPKNEDDEIQGLIYRDIEDSKKGFVDPMEGLVYRVHPVPQSLHDLIFDFGSLSKIQEAHYVRMMVNSACETMKKDNPIVFSKVNEESKASLSDLICCSQEYLRECEGDPSVVSLRDVNRCLEVFSWFLDLFERNLTGKIEIEKPGQDGKDKLPDKRLGIVFMSCTVLALSFVYYFRLGSQKSRDTYLKRIRESVKESVKETSKETSSKGEQNDLIELKSDKKFEILLDQIRQSFCDKIKIDEETAMNRALSENLFVTIVCILIKIPVFLVGKPGTSKTLALQIAANNLQGVASPTTFWQRFPSIRLFQYQCSPASSADAIQRQYDIACRFQIHAKDQISCLLLDEIGLAEHSPEFPLKVLHAMLVKPPIAIVGISNWVLDKAKMNRAILISRPDPTVEDLHLTGKRIFESSASSILDDKNFTSNLSVGYDDFLKNENSSSDYSLSICGS